MLRWWRSRGEDDTPGPGVPTGAGSPAADEIRAAIGRLVAQRQEATRSAGAALVNQAVVQRAIATQRRALDETVTQLDDALALARRVADTAAAEDGEPAAAPYRQHVSGLEAQAQVVAAAQAQLAGLGDTSRDQVDAARALLARSYAAGDAALRVQLRLLVALERLERERVIRAHRAAAGTRNAHGDTR